MIKFNNLFFLILICLVGCDKDEIIIEEKPIQPLDSVCRLPIEVRIPHLLLSDMKLSPNGDKLLFIDNFVSIYNINNNNFETIPADFVIGNGLFNLYQIFWSCSDNDVIYFIGKTSDSSYSGPIILKYNHKTNKVEKYIPALFQEMYNKYKIYQSSLVIKSVIKGQEDEDEFYCSSFLKGPMINDIKLSGYYIYRIYGDEFGTFNFFEETLRISNDYSLTVSRDKLDHGNTTPMYIAVNRVALRIKEKMPSRIFNVSISPDNNKIAICLEPNESNCDEDPRRVFPEIWILDYGNYIKNNLDIIPIIKIDIRKKYCMYNYLQPNVEFITSNQLVVNMHKNGDYAVNLYQININDFSYKQLTFR